jgi:AraC-like DNA-binding protein/mannose-6-phosphate isomerase-like protein (cupin superfamily)
VADPGDPSGIFALERRPDPVEICMKPICQLASDPGLRPSICGVFIAPGFGRHLDRTQDCWELIVVERGHLGIAVDTREYDLGPGQWLLIPAGVRHYGTQDFPKHLRFSWLHFHPRPGHGLALPDSGMIADLPPVLALIRRYIARQTTGSAEDPVAAMHLALILAELTVVPTPVPDVDELATRAIRVIQTRFREPDLSTAVVARNLSVGADHLGRVFRRAFSTTVLDAINRHRLDEAKRLLVIGQLRLGDAARTAGFRNAQWLSRLLRRQDGVGPKEWRRMHARIHVNTA